MPFEMSDCIRNLDIAYLDAIRCMNESAYECDIACQETMLSNLENAIILESVQLLCEDAQAQFSAKSKSVVEKFFDAVSTFIKTITSKISQHITEKKTERNLKAIQDEINKNPELAREKIEVFDLNTMSKAQQDHFVKVQRILNKQKSGRPLTEKEEEELVKFANDDYSSSSKAKVLVPVSVAVAAIGGTLAYCKASGKSLNDLASDAKNSINASLSNIKEKSARETVERCQNQMAKTKTAIARLGEDRVKLLSPIESNLGFLNKLIDRLINRETRMNKRAESDNLIVRATGSVGRARQRAKETGGLLGIGIAPSRRVRIETYGKQRDRNRKMYDNISGSIDKKIDAKNKELERLQRKMNKAQETLRNSKR